MDLHFANQLEANVTSVSNDFIDNYMTEANGEYIKVYLYLLRHNQGPVSEGAIADALNHTEADVRRALSYWQKAGVLASTQKQISEPLSRASGREDGDDTRAAQEQSAALADDRNRSAAQTKTENGKAAPSEARTHCSERDMNRLSKDSEFSQLIYIAQKYMNKVFTPVDCEIFAYLYSTLRMPAELLEYLVEYCVQNNHTSLRYIEKVALSWHEKKLLTVEEAKAYSKGFSKDIFSVMKAFGLTGRAPGEKEYEDIERWLKSYGFTKEIVVEACNRTMEAIHTPSFQYAEQILKEWKKAEVRTLQDIENMDKIRQEQKARGQKDKDAGTQTVRKTTPAKPANRFHNLEEHGYDYEKIVWDLMNAGQNK